MGMVHCTECGKEISEKAQSCPGCGAVVGKPESKTDFYVLGELISANKWKGTFVLEHPDTKLRKYFISGNAKFISPAFLGFFLGCFYFFYHRMWVVPQ